MQYFSPDFFHFFEQLEDNNHKAWFDEHKQQYVQNVKDPFNAFIGEIISRVSLLDPRVTISPKEAIFRIYRDVRFSKDKTPYKNHVSAVISPKGRKDLSSAGIYIELNKDQMKIYSGMYKPDKEQLYKIREAIARDLSHFSSLIEDPAFKKSFGVIRGEQNVRIPKEFKEAAEVQPLLFNKQLYYFATIEKATILGDQLPDEVIKYYEISRPLSDFFKEALGN